MKLSILQYKIIYNFIYTNCISTEWKKVENPHCPFCTNVGLTVAHYSYRVPVLVLSGPELIEWCHFVSKNTLSLSKNEIIYGVLNNWPSCSALNHPFLVGKYFFLLQSIKER